jgi:hypothetical protein
VLDRLGGPQETGGRVLGIGPRPDSVPAMTIASCGGSASPVAARNCHSTGSRPVIA